jgi:hypothetical protein
VIELQSLAFGPFPDSEPLNPRFVPGHPKLRLTVDAERHPRVPDRTILHQLVEAFPGLARHRCEIGAGLSGASPDSRGITMLEDEPSANQAHLLEHLLLEMLSLVDGQPRLSGVTCAYAEPPERNDVFVECGNARLGELASLLALETLNAALAGESIAPLYADATRVAGAVVKDNSSQSWSPGEAARRTDLASRRAAAALQILRGLGFLEEEEFAMNFSGEPLYRVSNGRQSRSSRLSMT